VNEDEREEGVVDEGVNLCKKRRKRTGTGGESQRSEREGEQRDRRRVRDAPVGLSASYQFTVPPNTPFLIIFATSALFLLT
jgi:hypothetical protein